MGPGIKKGLRLMGFTVSTYDIAPTLLHIYGIEPPKQMRGRVITELFDATPARAAGAGK
jgi:arylsulfatase A-like enzyme